MREFWILVTLAATAAASQGDRSPAYQACLATCRSHCPVPASVPRPSWTLWPCPSECSYQCLTRLTDAALDLPRSASSSITDAGGVLDGLEPGRMVQFHGKWPFRRYFGMQEPVSVMFSLCNLAAHWAGLRALRRVECRTASARMLQRDYGRNALVGINTWVWSSVFHTRDVDWTERADYFSAAASTLYGLWLVLDRLAHFHRPCASDGRVTVARHLSQVVFLAVLVAHCAYLSIGRFDYGYNMRFNLVAGVSQIVLWVVWSFTTSATADASAPLRHRRDPLLPAFLLLSSTALEVLDFEPTPSRLRLVDAHALWHASTIWIVMLWYSFLRKDLAWVELDAAEELKREM